MTHVYAVEIDFGSPTIFSSIDAAKISVETALNTGGTQVSFADPDPTLLDIWTVYTTTARRRKFRGWIFRKEVHVSQADIP